MVGLAVMRELLARNPGMNLVVVEKESALARRSRIAPHDTMPSRRTNAPVLHLRSAVRSVFPHSPLARGRR